MSFTDYLGTLGAKRVPVGYVNSNTAYNTGLRESQGGDTTAYKTSRLGLGLGASVPSLSSRQQRAFNQRGYGGQNYSSADGYGPHLADGQTYSADRQSNLGYASGYVDSEGGFLGYGNSLGELSSNTALNNQYMENRIDEPLRKANEEKQRLANEQAFLSLQQRRAAIRAAESNNPQFTSSGLVGMGQQGTAPQQFGRAAVPGMGRGTGQGIGRGTGQGLLGGLHRGAAPTGGGQ